MNSSWIHPRPPDQLSVGGFSSAGFHQYVFYRLQQEGHFKSIWVPFRGGQDAALACWGSHRCRHHDAELGAPQIKSGDIRLLGISSAERDGYFPDMPTFKEQGYDVVRRFGAASWSRPERQKPSSIP